MSVLWLKLLLVPGLIGAITLAGRRFGPAVAGWLSAFPVVSAPILAFICFEQGPEFAAQAAVGTLSAVLAILVFGLGYAWSATRLPWPASLALAFAGYAIAVSLLTWWAPGLGLAASAVLLALLLAPRMYPIRSVAGTRAASGWADLCWRMLAGALLVLLVTQLADRLGPRLSGLFAMFPVMGSVLTVFSHRSSGAAFAIDLLRGMVPGFYAFASFCVVLTLSLSRQAPVLAFVAAIVSALLVQIISRRWVLRLR